LVQSGGRWATGASARAGFIPVALSRIPVAALRSIPVYIRIRPERDGVHTEGSFRLYCGRDVPCTESRLQRLVNNNVKFLYIRVADHDRFRKQVEDTLEQTAADPAIAASARSAIVYETSLEIVNELLEDPSGACRSGRLDAVAKSVTSLVIGDPMAFAHLFAISHHDFYTATHLVNVGTWMVSLGYAMGMRDPALLRRLCTAGLLHDVGKLEVPPAILNKPGALTEDEWKTLRRHPESGYEHLRRVGIEDPLILAVTLEHHERCDGSGYPKRLKGSQMHEAARLCAVVDSFDAMTAVRPFKQYTMSIAEAIQILTEEAPGRYDSLMVEAWASLVAGAGALTPSVPEAPAEPAEPALECRRLNPRDHLHCQGIVHELVAGDRGFRKRAPMPIIAHNMSLNGLGFLCQFAIRPGQMIKVRLDRPDLRSRSLEGRVIHCRSYGDSWHEIGMMLCESGADAAPDGLKGEAESPAADAAEAGPDAKAQPNPRVQPNTKSTPSAAKQQPGAKPGPAAKPQPVAKGKPPAPPSQSGVKRAA
jgi:HD-GYP domain-containing protein (c-di-GMP phosphodiesterase class II)